MNPKELLKSTTLNMEPSCKYLVSPPSATQRSSNAKDAALDYSLNNNNNNSIHTTTTTNGLVSKQQTTLASDNNLQQFPSNSNSSHSPQLSPANSSLSSQSAALQHLGCDDAANADFISVAKQETINNNHQPASSANSSYNSSFGSNSGRKLITESVVPAGGVVTTQNISTVIRPRSNNNSLQFVKIKTPESSIKAVEQVRIAEENKISKNKIKEVEEEWQNNLLNWKSKRRQQFSHSIGAEQDTNTSSMFGGGPDENSCNTGRKVKTFAEMIEERAKSGNRLGFHLQRYIGAEEDEEEGELSLHRNQRNGHSIPANNSIKQDTQNNKQVLDSDDCLGEAHSSTSSGNSDLGEKSLPTIDPTPPPRTMTATPIVSVTPNTTNKLLRIEPQESVPECDNSHLEGTTAKLEHRDETDNLHSISLVGGPLQADQLSSTLRPAENDNSHHHSSITSQLNEVKAKINQLRGARSGEDSSDDSVYEEDEEEDEEEHEEQKQLQRIAFEAKLKAFERLTQPPSAQLAKHGLLKPKPLPKRTLGNSSMQSDHDSRLESIRSQTAEMRLKATVRPQDCLIQPEAKERVKETPTTTTTTTTQEPKIAAPVEYRLQQQLSQTITLPPATQLEQDPIVESQSPPPPPVPVPVQRPLPNRFNEAPTHAATTDRLVPSDHTISARAQAPMDSPQPPPSPVKELSLSSSFIQSNVYQSPSPPPSSAQLSSLPQPQPPLPPPPPPAQAHSIQRNDSSSFKSQTPSSKRTSKDDKDRTVLSVSGKKRCSSCKEELGRGAAAFVVESLGLVYHTNCFRCSVCHVNLSNGFRGVDVRVHAGALHCQNCYSKDGLNYSRV